MTMTSLVILVHGLIALVPQNQGNGSNSMTALVVNALQQPAGMQQCYAPHTPMLVVSSPNSAECIAAGCTITSTECICDFSTPQLQRKQVQLNISPTVTTASTSPLAPAPKNELPFGAADAGDFGYLANLARSPISAQLNPAFLALDPTVVPPALIARMSFPFDSVTACTLSTRRDEGSNNVHSFNFRSLGTLESPGDLNQALAQQAVFLTGIPGGSSVTVTISDFDGGNAHSIGLGTILNPVTMQNEYLVKLHNSRADLGFDDPCDDGVGRDFAFFYELAQQPPAWSARLLPHLRNTRWKSARDVQAPACNQHAEKTLTSRPVCAVATFN